MQIEYEEKRAKSKKNDLYCSFYQLGIGTVDESVFVSKHEGKSVEYLEPLLKDVRKEIKELVRLKKACICNTQWAVDGSKAKGNKATNRQIKLRLRCFDNSCKSALALVDWNNIERLKVRIKMAFDLVNQTASLYDVHLMPTYMNVRIRELEIKYELDREKANAKEQLREERLLQREAEREEKRIKDGAEKAIKKREFQEKLVARELEKIKSLKGEKLAELERTLAKHRKELELLQQVEQRAVSMAQQTRAGFVYIISNNKSFDQDMCKIGMTRRVDPNDRVRELGDASVPELFDVHGFVYTDDAPKLEKELHERYAEKRVNLVNKRKEFFFVPPEEVIKSIEQQGFKVSNDL